jgi:hypothetical protein
MIQTTEPRVLDCRKVDGRMSSLSFRPLEGGLRGSVAAHEGRKPYIGDYLALDNDGSGARLYRVDEANWCMNVDPAKMWMAKVTFIPGRDAVHLDLSGWIR